MLKEGQIRQVLVPFANIGYDNRWDIEKEKNSEENIQIIVENLKKKRNRILRRLYRNVYRLKKAFPAINTKEITEVLNKKLDEIKNKRNK